MDNPYRILSVPPDATEEEIKRAYRAKAQEYHPDRAGDSAITRAKFLQLKEAYDLLSDPEKRAEHDRRNRPLNAHHIAHGPYDFNRKGPIKLDEVDDTPIPPVIPKGWKAWQKVIILFIVAAIAMACLIIFSPKPTP